MKSDTVIIKDINGIKYLQFKKLLEFDNIIHAFYFGKELDFKTRDANGNIYVNNYENYDKFLNNLGLDYNNCIKGNQSHTANTKIVDVKYNNKEPDFNLKEYEAVDALITNKDNFILTTTAADCILVFIYDPVKNVIANVHSGWRGTYENIVVKTVVKMHEEYDCNYSDILCFICPSIRKCHFEVDNDIYMKFKFRYVRPKYYIKYSLKWHIDLVAIVKDELMKLGVLEENIYDSKICTMCNNDKLNSYRFDKEKFKLSCAIITKKGE